jgi:hypothetical protein
MLMIRVFVRADALKPGFKINVHTAGYAVLIGEAVWQFRAGSVVPDFPTSKPSQADGSAWLELDLVLRSLA